MKTLPVIILMLIALLPQEKRISLNQAEWRIIWEENFEGSMLDTAKWNIINTRPGQRASDWNRHMINDSGVYSVRNGNLYLTAIKNPGVKDDPRPFLTGGVDSKGK